MDQIEINCRYEDAMGTAFVMAVVAGWVMFRRSADVKPELLTRAAFRKRFARSFADKYTRPQEATNGR